MNNVFCFLLFFILVSIVVMEFSVQCVIFVEEIYVDEDFDLLNSELLFWDIIFGGFGKDGIFVFIDLEFIMVKSDKWFIDEDCVVGVIFNGVSKVYLVWVLNYYEIINDDFDGLWVVIIYSLFCGSVMVYQIEECSQEWELVVLGLVYNNNVLYFDWEIESFWLQVLGCVVVGLVVGVQL